MRYILDDNNYIKAISFGSKIECYGKECVEYTGAIPSGYSSLGEWASNAVIQAYYISEGELVYDAAKEAEIEATAADEAAYNKTATEGYVKKTYATKSELSTVEGKIPTGAAASKGVVTSVDTSSNLPTSNAVKTFVEGKGYLKSAPVTSVNGQTGAVTIGVPAASDRGYNGYIFAGSDGVAEIGKYIDFHATSTDTKDHDVRFICPSLSVGVSINLPSSNGTLALTTSNVSSATKAAQDSEGNQINTTYYKASSLSSDLLAKIYPVGSIYMSVNSTSPASFLGGTWYQLQDRFLLGAGSYSNGSTGGSATHTLTINEMPNHNHQGLYWQQSSYGISLDGGGSSIYMNHSWTGKTNTTSLYTGSKGNGQAHNNMPPYLVVYMWRRTV